MRRQRKPRLPAELDDMPWWLLCQLRRVGELTSADLSEHLKRRHEARYGGIDPYAHLRPLGDDESDPEAVVFSPRRRSRKPKTGGTHTYDGGAR